MSYYEGLYWTEQKNVDMRFIKKELRVTGSDFVGDKIVDCWELQDNMIGLPVYWARRQGLQGRNLASCPIVAWPNLEHEYRDQQWEAVQQCMAGMENHGSHLLWAHTGFGKTFIGIHVAERLSTNALVIVNQSSLIDQWGDTAEKLFGVDWGIIQGDIEKWDWQKPVAVATMQSLGPKLGSLPPGFLEHFGLTIFDEGHHSPCDTIQNILKKIPSMYRLGVSATWRRRDKLDRVWQVHMGPVGQKFKDKNQEKNRYVSFLPVNLKIDEDEVKHRGKVNHSKYLTVLAENEEYNWLLCSHIAKMVEAGRKVLVISHRTRQLELLEIALDSRGLNSIMYSGKTKKSDKDKLRDYPIILSTERKFAEGVDLPELDTLVCCTPFGDIEQVAGRITRKNKDKRAPYVLYPIVQTDYLIAISWKIRKQFAGLGFKERKL